jgi:hypothetical protein
MILPLFFGRSFGAMRLEYSTGLQFLAPACQLENGGAGASFVREPLCIARMPHQIGPILNQASGPRALKLL